MLNTTALDALREETKQRPIITLCRRLDSAIGNGIPTGIITEFCGPPGCGKTQFCLQLCVNVQIPKCIGGTGGEAIFIDTCQDFNPYRLKEIASSCSNRYEEVFKNSANTSTEIEFSTESILNKVFYYYCGDHNKLLAAIEYIKNILKTENNIKLIAIDSICQPFRILTDYPNRTRILQQLLTDLQIIADEYALAVILTNDLTTRFDDNDQQFLCPALGESHGHKIGQRIMLGRIPESKEEFLAYLEKTIFSPPQLFKFKITQGGIRGAD